jgi:hypothetical protein
MTHYGEQNMSANARTWFYTEPERKAYFIEERVNQNLWANRLVDIYLDCVHAEPPFRMEGLWQGMNVSLEWEPNTWLRLTAEREEITLVKAIAQTLQLSPAFSYSEEGGHFVAEWWRDGGEKAYEQVKGNPKFIGIKRYKK